MKSMKLMSSTKDDESNDNNKTLQTSDELAKDREQIKSLPSYDGMPLKINMTFYIDDINSISDVNMDFRVDFYYMMEWTAKNPDCHMYQKSLQGRNISVENVTQSNKLIITKDYFTLFWLPDIMVANAKQVKQQSDLIETILLMIHFEGHPRENCHMQYMARFYSIVSCPMDFHDAPVDSQMCSIQLRSFAFDNKRIELNWTEKVRDNPDLRLLEHDFTTSEEVMTTRMFNQTYSTLKVNIKFQRNVANKLVGVYAPSILIVLITFCSFWLGLNSTPERVTIGITALLALVTQFNDARGSLPATSYITEIDRWMIMCMVCVAAQLVQCTLVDFVYHRQKYNQKLRERTSAVISKFKGLSHRKHPDSHPISQIEINNNPNQYPNEKAIKNLRLIKNAFKKPPIEEKRHCLSGLRAVLWSLISVPVRSDTPEFLPMRIDAISRILFPLFFTLICLIYWPTMLAKVF